jgi:hypothetical protein
VPRFTPPPSPVPSATPEVLTQCSDGVDNDGDGTTDFPADRQCRSADDEDEANP